MYSLLVMLSLATAPLQYTNHILPFPVEWKTATYVSNHIRLKSTLKLERPQVKKIKNILGHINYLFFNEFEPDLRCADMGQMEIRIIRLSTLTNKKYFVAARATNFGRYFSITNTLYIVPDMLKNPEWLAHEMAHYYYDECRVKFKDARNEHLKVYKFQDLYARWALK